MPPVASPLSQPLRRIVQARSKRLRPFLILSIAAASSKEVDETVLKAAAAVELIHLGSLVHDDTIDKAASRWNTATISSQEGTDTAIIAGDYLFAQAAKQAAMVSQIVAASTAAALAELCEGQSLELADQYNAARSRESYLRAIHGKTASLFEASCRIGGLCVGLKDPQVQALGRYGAAFGMAFQLLDDTLDFISTDDLSGKPVGTDILQGVYTMPLLLALQKSQDKGHIKDLLHKKDAAGGLSGILLENGSIQKTLQLVKKYNDEALRALDEFDPAELHDFRQFPAAYTKWALANLIDEKYRSSISY